MDIVLLFLLNTLIFAVAFFLVSRRLHKMYNTKTFLREIELEVKSIMTAFNQSSDEHIEILEDRIEKLTALRDEANTLISKLENLKNSPIYSVDPEVERARAQRPTRHLEADEVKMAPKPTSPPVEESLSIDEPKHEQRDPRIEVVRLAAQGLSPEIISKMTGIPLGETELIISLRGRG